MSNIYYNILDDVISTLLLAQFPEAITANNGYNFRCNVCGDSKKYKSKKRGWILKNKEPWMFYCFNCQTSIPADIWLQKYFPDYHKRYLHLAFNIDVGGLYSPQPFRKSVKNDVEYEYDENDDIKYFIPIKSGIGELFEKSINICEKRYIPERIWEKWYVATGGKYRNRLIIPFYDNNNKIYSYQGRSLFKDQMPKYMGRKNASDAIYNVYNVDHNKPVICLEGMIDSIFIENAVAMTGLKKNSVSLKGLKNKYFLLDNDKDGRRVSLELLMSGGYVFIWGKFLKCLGIPPRTEKDDINDVIVRLGSYRQFKFDFLEQFFTNSVYDRIHLL